MSTYTLKSVVQRGSILSAVFAIVLATVLPASSAFADALNPLTERSLMLSSSAPGFVNTDGAGNAEGNLNSFGEEYAPPGSGPNGRKTGQTFSFKVSSDSTASGSEIKAFTLQYCTSAAGKCRGPGNNDPTPLHSVADGGDFNPDRTDPGVTASTRDLNDPTAWALGRSDLNVVDGFPQATGAIADGEFQIYRVVAGVDTAVAATDWTMEATNKESLDHSENLTGQNNFITLKSATGEAIAAGTVVKIVFKASTTNYITNPGAGAFFVKLNTFKSDDPSDLVPGGAENVDGGVTVANVMTDSIHITTKVLETMSFSVGTRNRDNMTLNCGAAYTDPVTRPVGCEANTGATHGTCDAMQNVNGNRLDLGNPDAEYSLEVGKGWSVNSFWRLSSNSSGGATVYYSGDTLRNTVGDHIQDMVNETISTPGTEQFGLGFVAPEAAPGGSEYALAYPGRTPDSAPFRTLESQPADPDPDYPINQDAADDYDEAEGTLDNGIGGAGTAQFKFLAASQTIPEPIAQENSEVVSCATAKMRYVGNIAADTPAGVYTTKINYLAAPQY